MSITVPVVVIGTWLKAWWSFLHGTDGLSNADQINRNLIVATGNIVLACGLLGAALVLMIVRDLRQ